jgi:hypothetical protein
MATIHKYGVSYDVVHYLQTAYWSLGVPSPYEKLTRSSLRTWFTPKGELQPNYLQAAEQGKLVRHLKRHVLILDVATPLWPSVGVKPNTSKVGDLESSGTLECLEFDSKAQNTSHWGFLGVIGKVLERRYRKWHRIGHSDICSPSYGQKKGQESNCQFDSRPLKVGNRPLPDLRIESAIRRWKDRDEGYKFGLDLIAIRIFSRELWAPKVPGLHLGQFRDNFGTPTWESREKVTFGRGCREESHSIL